MQRACIAIVDAARARVCTYEQNPDDPAHELSEVADLVNPQRRARPNDQTFDEVDARFAREVVVEIDRIARGGAYPRVVVIASPHILGALRKHDGVLRRERVVLDEIPRDLGKLSSAQLHDHLAALQVVPPRQRPGVRSAAR